MAIHGTRANSNVREVTVRLKKAQKNKQVDITIHKRCLPLAVQEQGSCRIGEEYRAGLGLLRLLPFRQPLDKCFLRAKEHVPTSEWFS